MKKDTMYFSHDYNASNDFKILFLRKKLGMEGYGIFWSLVESLANSGGYLPLNILPILAGQMKVNEKKIFSVVKDFNLFSIDKNEFYSVRLLKHLRERKKLSRQGKRGANLRWNEPKKNDSPPNSPPIAPPNAKERKGKESKVKERKGKESKVKERKEREAFFSPPAFLDVQNYCMERQNKVNPKRFFDYYQAKAWKIGKVQMSDWRACLRSWENNEIAESKKNENWMDKYKPKN